MFLRLALYTTLILSTGGYAAECQCYCAANDAPVRQPLSPGHGDHPSCPSINVEAANRCSAPGQMPNGFGCVLLGQDGKQLPGTCACEAYPKR